MHSRWGDLYPALVAATTSLRAAKYFQSLRNGDPLFARFNCSTDLIAYFHDGDDLDFKDRLYAALVRIAQARRPSAQLAYALLWCGLWPGLDHVYRRNLRRFTSDPDELTEAISVAFTVLIDRMDLARVHRVAATLVRSTHRDVVDEQCRVQLDGARIVHGFAAAAAPAMGWQREPAELQPTGLSFASELAMLRSHLVQAVGSDADLVLAVLVLGYDQHEIAQLTGISYEATRKRIQRAVVRIRDRLLARVGARGAAVPAQTSEPRLSARWANKCPERNRT
jgi:DNA-directed RNA polymerase specialized sigma24 family protein